MPSNLNKKNRKSIINEHIFGKYCELGETNPDSGISDVKIDVQEMGNIPGLINHWKKDIEIRKAEIMSWKNQDFLHKAIDVLTNTSSLSPKASGIELYILHPTNTAKKVLTQLKKNPLDMRNRLEMVSIAGKSGREFPLEVYRTLFLQATVASSLGTLDSIGLQIVLWTQDNYLSKLLNRSKYEVGTLKYKLESSNNNAFSIQSNNMLKRIRQIESNIAILKQYEEYTKRARKLLSKDSISLNLDELYQHIIKGDLKNEKKEILIRKAYHIFRILRYLPLLHDEGLLYLDNLRKIDPHEPLYHFYQAQLYRSKLVFSVALYEGLDYDVKIVKEIQSQFKNTYHQYGLAVRKVGTLPKKKTDFTIFIEFANLLHYFYQISVHVLGVQLPKEWLKSSFEKAKHVLNLVDNPTQISNLRNDILKDMVHAGLIE